MTTYYVDSAGSNTSPYDTWVKAATSLQTVADLAVAGDTIYARGTETLSAPVDIDQNNGSAASGWIKVIGCAEDGSVDGTQFVLDGNSSAANCLVLAGGKAGYWWFENLRFINATGDGVAFGSGSAAYRLWINCRASSNGGNGWEGYYSANTFMADCFIRCCSDANSAAGWYRSYYGTVYLWCISIDNTNDGFGPGSTAACWLGCISHNNGGHGINQGTVTSLIVHCILDENDDDGINSQGYVVIVASRLTDNGKDGTGYGLNEAGSYRAVYGWNFLIDNDSGATNGNCDAIPYDSDTDTNETTGTEGYADGGSDNFNLTLSATLRRVALDLDGTNICYVSAGLVPTDAGGGAAVASGIIQQQFVR